MLQEKQREMDQYIISLENENKYSPFVTESLKKMNLEDFDLSLILNLLKHICINMEDGAILVFLPGWDTISKLHDMLQSDVMFRKSSRYLIIPLHSLMPTSSQKQVGVVLYSIIIYEKANWLLVDLTILFRYRIFLNGSLAFFVITIITSHKCYFKVTLLGVCMFEVVRHMAL